MKKSFLLLGLLTTTICLTACWSKNYNMSFEEALEIANHSALQDILTENNFEQNFDISGNYDTDWTKVNADIALNSKQNLDKKISESSTKFTADIASSWEIIKANWKLDIKMINDAIYLNLSSFNLTWSEDLSLVGIMAEWIKNQWFSIPMSGLSDMPNTFSILKDSEGLNTKIKEIVTNEWSEVYNWKFTQFNWYNSWKFSLDNEKLNTLIKEYYDEMNANLDEESIQTIPELNIQNFEWYLIITGKDKVTTVIENMAIAEDEIIINAKWFAGEDFELYLSEDGEDIISIIANKKGGKYEVSANIANTISLNWTISPKLSKSSINLKFDAKLIIKSETQWEKDTIIPFNGSWKYNSISEFTTSAPEDAKDLTELLWSYLGGMVWWDELDYNEDYNYEDLYADEENNTESIDTEWEVAKVEENTEATESTETTESTMVAE